MRHCPRKRFGQNFLKNRSIIDGIVRAINPQSKDNILEIGPGLGALTKPLLRYVDHLTAIEIDTDLQNYLAQQWTPDRLQIVACDALSVDYSQFGTKVRVVGNLPYNISTPLLIHLVQFIPCIEDMHFMLQKEVVERMAAEPGSKAYGRLTVMLQYHCMVESLFDVPPEAFEPQPKVNSAMVRLIPHQNSPFEAVSLPKLEYLVARAFAMRRKTLNNNLKGFMSAEQLSTLGIDGNRRPEQISVAEYIQIAEFNSN